MRLLLALLILLLDCNARCNALADGAIALLRVDGVYCQLVLSDGQVVSGKLSPLEAARGTHLDLQNDPRYYPPVKTDDI